MTRRDMMAATLASSAMAMAEDSKTTSYVRFRTGNTVSYGRLDGDTVFEIKGDLFSAHKESGAKHKLSAVKLLVPCVPPKVLAVGLNYKSHIGNRTPPPNPEMFYKPITCLQHPGDPIKIPDDSKNTHYEGELVIVIGKPASHVSVAVAPKVIFGV